MSLLFFYSKNCIVRSNAVSKEIPALGTSVVIHLKESIMVDIVIKSPADSKNSLSWREPGLDGNMLNKREWVGLSRKSKIFSKT